MNTDLISIPSVPLLKKGINKVLAFDIDETLGSFQDLEMLWRKIMVGPFFFNELLDLFPEFLRYGILPILDFIYKKKLSKECAKIYIYTNNQCSPEWTQRIADYFDYKLMVNHGPKVFDKVINAFKINNRRIEMGRTGHDKRFSDFIRCTILPKNTEVCFIDNTFYRGMVNDRVYYIQPLRYNHHLSSEQIFRRFTEFYGNKLGSHLTLGPSSITQDLALVSSSITEDLVPSSITEDLVPSSITEDLENDILVAKKLMYHIKEFFFLGKHAHKTRKTRPKKDKKRNKSAFTKKSKTQ